MRKYLCCLLVLLAVLGCVTRRALSGRDIAAAQVREIVPHATTRAQVLAWFGEPERIEKASDGSEELVYGYRGSVERTTELLAFAKKTTTEERKTLRVRLQGDLVTEVRYTNSAEPAENLVR